MPTVTGTIEAVSVKERTTQWGTKNATSFKLNNEWYSGGFKTWEVDKGDAVELTYEVNGKGYKDVSGIAVTTKGAPPPTTAAQSGAPRGGRAFPMDALDPGRVIVRQNSLAHAVNYCNNTMSADPYTIRNVIEAARQFEAYSCGDLDQAEAMAMAAGDPNPDA